MRVLHFAVGALFANIAKILPLHVYSMPTLCMEGVMMIPFRDIGIHSMLSILQTSDGGYITMKTTTKPTSVLVYHATTLQDQRLDYCRAYGYGLIRLFIYYPGELRTVTESTRPWAIFSVVVVQRSKNECNGCHRYAGGAEAIYKTAY